ncbi:MAG: SAM-dependent methyltransferase [Pleurocapsa sp.]
MDTPEHPNSEQLQKIINESIKNSAMGCISFAEYMDLVLYHPDYGYYSSGVVKIGAAGDFFTSSSLGRDFGELLAIQFVEMWHKLDCPDPFFIVEMGSGNGQLARDILTYLDKNNPDLAEILEYIIIEESPKLTIQQQELLNDFTGININWQSWQELENNSINGVFFSNELVDAFPVHRVTNKDNKLQEIYLTLERDKLTETIGEVSTTKINRYFEFLGINLLTGEYSPNYQTEVNLRALAWLKTVASKLKQGYLVTIDYGYKADKYYHPQRSQGTLQCYYQHRRHNNPYVNLGYQDITTHVNFSALESQGKLCNLETIGFTQQGLFLMALGLGDRLNELSSGKYNIQEIFKRRDALHQLIDPIGLGGFGVLIQGKELDRPEMRSLLGLNIPQL